MIKKILVSQPKPSSERSPYYEIARRCGVQIDFHPFVKVEGVSPKEFRQQHISILDYTAVVFTSRHAIDNFFQLCKELRINVPDDMKYFCITETVALYIQKYVQYRKRKVFFGTTGKIDDIIPQIVKHKNDKYFIPLSNVHNNEFADILESKKIVHKEGVMYRTVPNPLPSDKPFDYDMVILFSPSGLNALIKNIPDIKKYKVAIGTFGPTTAKAVKEAGLKLKLEAPSQQYPSITSALNAYLEKVNG